MVPIPIISVLEKLRQKDQKFEVILHYTVS